MLERQPLYMKEGQLKGSLRDQIADRIRERITKGDFTGRLPSMEVLVRDVGVSRVTIRHALKILEKDGLLYIRQGLGTFVASSSEPRTRPERTKDIELYGSGPVSSNLEALEPTPLENLLHGLRLYIGSKQRKAEIALGQQPSQENQARLLELAGQVEILDILGVAVGRNPKNSLLVAGIASLFEREINTIRQYPTLDDAITEI